MVEIIDGRDEINSAGMKRVTFEQAYQGEPRAFKGAMLRERLNGIG
jgi:hypothetical protein